MIDPTSVTHWSPPLPEAPGFEHLVVESPGLRTHVAAIGEGTPVVMLHGFPQHWWQWHTIAPAVAAAGCRVYCPDLRGAGWTVAASPRVQRETRMHDLLAIFDALGLTRVDLVSHDMGVLSALPLTYEYPERVRSAVQFAVWPGFIRFSLALGPAFEHLPPFIWHRPGASLRGTFSDRYVAHPMPEETKDIYLAPMGNPLIDAAVRPLVRRMLMPEALRIVTGHYRRRRLTVPTLVVFGRQDSPTTEELMSRLCREPERFADRIEFAYVDDAKHFITDDQPAEVARLTIDWLSRVAA